MWSITRDAQPDRRIMVNKDFQCPSLTRIGESNNGVKSLTGISKMFNTSNMDSVKSCQLHFSFDMPSILWAKRARSFDIKFSASDNMLCKATAHSL